MTEQEFLIWARHDHEGYDKLQEKFEGQTESSLKYIYHYYTMDSDIHTRIRNISKKKEECCRLSKISVDKKRCDKEFLDRIFMVRDPEFSFFIVEYSKLQRSRIWAMIIANEQMFYEYEKILMEPITESDNDRLKGAQLKGKIRLEMEEIDKSLQKYYRELFPEGNVTSKEHEIQRITPENIGKTEIKL